jgi:hypothetical protein
VVAAAEQAVGVGGQSSLRALAGEGERIVPRLDREPAAGAPRSKLQQAVAQQGLVALTVAGLGVELASRGLVKSDAAELLGGVAEGSGGRGGLGGRARRQRCTGAGDEAE